jgi:hypothetical protein
LEGFEPPGGADRFVAGGSGAGVSGGDGDGERCIRGSVATDICEELGYRFRGQVADGDDAVVARGTAQWCMVGPVGAAPDRDAGLLRGTGEEPHVVDVKMGAVVVDVLPRPELGDDLESLVEERGVGSVEAAA